jgi:hypothetical protein
MRLLIWILGLICTLHALMTARAIAPAWVWVFYVWLGLWVLVGAVVLIAALVRAAAGSSPRAALRAPASQAAPIARTQGGE